MYWLLKYLIKTIVIESHITVGKGSVSIALSYLGTQELQNLNIFFIHQNKNAVDLTPHKTLRLQRIQH